MKLLTQEEYIQRCKDKHGETYDLSRVQYKNRRSDIKVGCKKHGFFTINSWLFIEDDIPCKKCREELKNDKKLNIEQSKKIEKEKLIYQKENDFKEYCSELFNNFYIYDEVEYENSNKKVCIICPKHGEFWMTPHNHKSGHGCPICAKEKLSELFKSNTEEFIEKANILHRGFYIYDLVNYVNNHTYVDIICPIHGKFKQTPAMHLSGQGCPKCNSSFLERQIRFFLTDNNIEFIEQCGQETFKWLERQKIDFYLPKFNIGIECQGRQHFMSIKHFGGEDGLNEIKERDDRKLKLCQEHNIKLLYFSNLGIEYPYHVFEDKNLLLEEIIK